MHRAPEERTLEKTQDLLTQSRRLLRALSRQIDHETEEADDDEGHECFQGDRKNANSPGDGPPRKPR
jgi:hypothetical protein